MRVKITGRREINERPLRKPFEIVKRKMRPLRDLYASNLI